MGRGVEITEFTVKIKIPDRLAQLLVWLVLFYRRLRYGYPFRRIPLTKGKFAIVDPSDFPHLNKYNWRVCNGRNTFYAERSVRLPFGRSRRILMHREILQAQCRSAAKTPASWSLHSSGGHIFENPSATKNSELRTHNCHRQYGDGFVIDHINRNGLDNRRANLRFATIAQNAQNSRMRKNRSGYKGVWFAKDKGRFRAAIWYNNKRIYLGYFNSPISAAKAYDEAARKYHKEFAVLNFPH